MSTSTVNKKNTGYRKDMKNWRSAILGLASLAAMGFVYEWYSVTETVEESNSEDGTRHSTHSTLTNNIQPGPGVENYPTTNAGTAEPSTGIGVSGFNSKVLLETTNEIRAREFNDKSSSGVNRSATSKNIDRRDLDNPFKVNPDQSASYGIGNPSTKNAAPANVSPENEIDVESQLLQAALDDDRGNSLGLINIDFTFSPLPEIRLVPIPASINVQQPIYAHLSAQEKCRTCIYKWQHYESGEVELITTTSLNSDQPFAIYTTPEHGWSRGRYVMSVYDAEASNQLLGRNSVELLNVHVEPLTLEPEVEFIHALLSKGRATSKIAQLEESEPAAENTGPDLDYIQSLLSSGEAVPKNN